MYTYTSLECMSTSDCTRVAQKDATKMSKDVKNYVKVNTLSYYILINTWLLLWKSLAGHAWSYVAGLIDQKGLIATIAEAQAEAIRVVSGTGGELSRLCLSFIQIEGSSRFFDDTNITRDARAALLFLLRYPKRFSPNGNDLIKDATMADFIATENRTCQLQRHEYSYYVLSRVRDVVTNMYDWDDICAKIDQIEAHDILFSNGVGQDSGSSLGSKLLAIAKGNHCDEYFHRPFGSILVPIPATQREGLRYVKPLAVPKSYKASRIIAPENTYRQAFAKRVEYIFRDADMKRYDHQLDSITNALQGNMPIMLTDQGINQELASMGSISGRYATLDASHASDMISKSLFRSLFPNEVVRRIDPLLSEYTEINGKVRRMQMASTSGHALTFRLESIVYKAIAQAAAEFVDTISRTHNAFAWAYGDDVIINTDAAETAAEWYNALGLVINYDKSFWSYDLLYRESCGKEYYQGIDMSTVSFPRFPIVGSMEPRVTLSSKSYNDEYRGKIDSSLTMLIDLQKKLFPYSRDAALFVLEVLRAADPRLTTSLPGTVCTDLWGYVDTGRPVTPKAYNLVDVTLYVNGVRWKKYVLTDEIDIPLKEADCKELIRLANLDKYHSCPKVKFVPRVGADDDLAQRVYDAYRYQEFLKHGPKYDSELDRLLGVSSKPVSLAEFFGKKELVMAFVR